MFWGFVGSGYNVVHFLHASEDDRVAPSRTVHTNTTVRGNSTSATDAGSSDRWLGSRSTLARYVAASNYACFGVYLLYESAVFALYTAARSRRYSVRDTAMLEWSVDFEFSDAAFAATMSRLHATSNEPPHPTDLPRHTAHARLEGRPDEGADHHETSIQLSTVGHETCAGPQAEARGSCGSSSQPGRIRPGRSESYAALLKQPAAAAAEAI
jgi:hypothetical protein